jgi:membrane-bound serine protease (ClpP class)
MVYSKTFAYISFFTLLIIILIGSSLQHTFSASGNERKAVLIDLSINVDGGALHLWNRASRYARDYVLILKINSYGGYLNVADRIVSDIIENNIECYTWIPPGGYAVSAAAMISLACNSVFMGSSAVIGDAIPSPSDPKTVEYVASRFRALAEKMFKGNENLTKIAEFMVREGRTLTTEEAVGIGFASKAETLTDLEKMLNVLVVETVSPGSWDRFVSLISLPLISEILLTAGVLLIVIEVLTTGFQGYAIAGILLIALALYGMNIISPNIFALILMLTGLILLAIEIYTPGFGAFGLSGIVLIAIGVGYQFYVTPPQLVSEPVYTILGGIATLMIFMGFIALKGAEAVRKKRVSKEELLLGSIGIAKTDIYETTPGVVYVLNEDWTAYSVKNVIPSGSKVRIVRVEGLKLYVEKVEEKK